METAMRIWVQVFSSRERNPNFHIALEEHLRSVVDPGVQIEVHGTRKGGLGEQFRFFQAIDTPISSRISGKLSSTLKPTSASWMSSIAPPGVR